MSDDLALTAARFGAALRAGGVPADPGRCERFARAVTVARPTTGRALYLCALATLISSQAQIEALTRVFGAMFGDPAARAGGPPEGDAPGVPGPARPPGDILAQAARAARMHAAQEGPPPPAGRMEEGQLLAQGEAEDSEPGAEEAETTRGVLASA